MLIRVRELTTYLDYSRWLTFQSERSTRFSGAWNSGNNAISQLLDECPIDGSNLLATWTNVERYGRTEFESSFEIRIKECTACGWWQLHGWTNWSNENRTEFGDDSCLYSAVQDTLTPVGQDILDRINRRLDGLSGKGTPERARETEELLNELFRDLGDYDASITGRSRDEKHALAIVTGRELFCLDLDWDNGDSCFASSLLEFVGAFAGYWDQDAAASAVFTSEGGGSPGQEHFNGTQRQLRKYILNDANLLYRVLGSSAPPRRPQWEHALKNSSLQVAGLDISSKLRATVFKPARLPDR
jgi:hypothetical protein